VAIASPSSASAVISGASLRVGVGLLSGRLCQQQQQQQQQLFEEMLHRVSAIRIMFVPTNFDDLFENEQPPQQTFAHRVMQQQTARTHSIRQPIRNQHKSQCRRHTLVTNHT
jgi:hypothetical protein